MAVADVNGDRDPDLAAALHNDDRVSVLLGEAGGALGQRREYAVGERPVSVKTGDFNGDGDPDLTIANFFGRHVSLLLGAAGGAFRPSQDLATGLQPIDSAVGDFNRDGDADLVVTNHASDDATVLLNTSAPAIAVRPTSLGFPDTLVGKTSAAREVTVENTGEGGLSVSDIAFGDADPGDFAIAADTCRGRRVAPRATCRVAVAFRPRKHGRRTASLTLSHNAPGSPHAVGLTGRGCRFIILDPPSLCI